MEHIPVEHIPAHCTATEPQCKEGKMLYTAFMRAHKIAGEEEWLSGPDSAKEENEKKDIARKAYKDHVALCRHTEPAPVPSLSDNYDLLKEAICRAFIRLIDS